MAGDMEATRVVVDVRDPQLFEVCIIFGQATGKKLSSRRQTIELQRKFGTLITHALATRR